MIIIMLPFNINNVSKTWAENDVDGVVKAAGNVK